MTSGAVPPLASVHQRPSINPLHHRSESLSPAKSQPLPDIDLNERSESPLHYAAQSGNHEKVQQLLQAHQRLARQNSRSRTTIEGVDLRLVDSHGFTALHYAVRGGFPKVVKSLLDFPGGRLTEVRDNVGKSAMHWGAQLGALNIVGLLCKAKASVIAEDRFGWMPLHYLCVSEAARDTQHEGEVIAIMNLMIEQKSPRGEAMRIWLLRDTQGRTPLHLAATNGVTNAVFRRLLELEPDYPLARMRDTNGWNSLHWAVFGGQTRILGALIEAAKNARSNVADTVNEQTTEGWSALHLTAMTVRSESAIKITEILVKECGAKTLLEDKKGRIPLYYAHLQAFNFPRIKGIKAIIPLLEGGGAGEAYRKRFSPGKTAFNEIASRHDAYLKRSKVLTFPRDPATVPGCRPFPYKACLTRLQKIIQQKQLEPIFSPPKASASDLSVVLFPYASSFSILPLAVKALPTSSPSPPIPNELILDLGALTLYDHAVVIDDSSSMGFALGGSRRESVLCVLRNISVINQFLNSPRGRELKTLCFSSAPNGRLNHQVGFDGCVNSHSFGGTSRVGTGVWESVVKPLLENWKIERPMVVMILTDGQIDPVEADILERAMLRATRKMHNLRASGAVLFQFVNFGSPAGGSGPYKAGEQQVLEMFMNHPELGRVVDVLNWETDQWDVAETQLVKISRAQDGWGSTQSKAAVEKMGRMLLAPMMTSYRRRFSSGGGDEAGEGGWYD